MSLGEKGNYKGQFLMSTNKSAVFSFKVGIFVEFRVKYKFSILALFHRGVNFPYLRFQSVFADMISLCTSLTSGHYANNGSEWKKLRAAQPDLCLSSVCMCLHWRGCKYIKCASRQLFVKSFRSVYKTNLK